MVENGKKIQMAEDISALKVQVQALKETMREQHDEVIARFDKLQGKVNEEITLMNDTIRNNRVFILRVLWISLALGSLIWIKESRIWILNHIFAKL